MDFSAAVLLFYALLITSVIAPALFAAGDGKHLEKSKSSDPNTTANVKAEVRQGVGEKGSIGEYFAPLLSHYSDQDRKMALIYICSIVNTEIFLDAVMTTENGDLGDVKSRRDVLLFYKKQIANFLATTPNLSPQLLVCDLIGVHAANMTTTFCPDKIPRRIPVLHTNN